VVPALVCLVLATLLCGVLLRQSAARRRSMRVEERRMQAEWLAESGLARARSRLAASHNYTGETWTIPATALGAAERRADEGGVVTIRVGPVDGQPSRRLVRVEATYPRAGDDRARQSKALTLELKPEPEREREREPEPRPETPGGPK
jgi:hypothetical protein